jgi:hypothetical protein
MPPIYVSPEVAAALRAAPPSAAGTAPVEKPTASA